jgi:hypothetical protein
MIIVEKLGVDINAPPPLSLAPIHHQQVESTGMTLGRFRQDFAGTVGRNSIGPRADWTRRKMHCALPFTELRGDKAVNVLISIQWKHSFIVPRDIWLVFEIWRIATPRLVVLPIKARFMPLLHSTDAQTVGENDVMDCE